MAGESNRRRLKFREPAGFDAFGQCCVCAGRAMYIDDGIGLVSLLTECAASCLVIRHSRCTDSFSSPTIPLPVAISPSEEFDWWNNFLNEQEAIGCCRTQ